MVNDYDVRRGEGNYKSINKIYERNKVLFRKQFSKCRASDNPDLQIKRSRQNKITEYNNFTYMYIKTIHLTQFSYS